MGNKTINIFTKRLLDMMFFTGILVEATIPLWMKVAGNIYSTAFKEHYWLMVVIFAVSGICALIIVNELRKMMKTVVEEDCFVQENVKSLKKMAKVSVVIAITFVVKIIFIPTPATFVIVLVFFIAALFSMVLSLVFQEAIHYKEENDLTI